MMVHISESQLARVQKILAGVPRGSERALANAVNRGLTTTRAKSATEVARVYRISSGGLKSKGRMKITNAKAGSTVTGSILFAGNMIPLIQFHATGGRGMVRAAVKRSNGGTPLVHAYIRNLGNGTGVFERESTKRESSKQLFGPSTAHMMRNEEVLEPVSEKAQETINKRLEQEISRLLSGYGG